MKQSKLIRRIISFTLILVIVVSSVVGCGQKDEPTISGDTVSAPTTEDIANAITEAIIQEAEEKSDDVVQEKTSEDKDDSIQGDCSVDGTAKSALDVASVEISYDWKDYAGNLDTLVYGLLTNELESVYDVFNAEIELDDGSVIYGLGYSAFDGFYEAEDGYGFFPAGFLAFIGEKGLPDNLVEAGVEIINLDYDDPKYSFVYAYGCESYYEHCVVWNQYLKYGVDEKGRITYTAREYEKNCWDRSLGSLYSYDAGRYIYDLNVGNYVYLSGSSLNAQIDYDALEAEINRILEEQDFNFSTQDIETSVYLAQEAVEDYLLSLQEESFLGFNVKELIACASEIDPMTCIRITPDGFVEIDLGKGSPGEPTALVKWMTGISCGIIIASTLALDLFVPALTPLSGAVSGAAFEVFMQVVVENQNLEDINWTKVAVSATSGALLAWACPLLASGVTEGVVNIMGNTVAASALSKLAGFATLTFSNSLVTGATSAAYAIIDGKTDEGVLNAFVIGAAVGGACTVVASAASAASNIILNIIERTHPDSWIIRATNSVGTFIGEHQIHLFTENIEKILAPKSVYAASECALNEIKSQRTSEKILVDAVKQLPSDKNHNIVKLDSDGKVLNKLEIEANGGDCIIKLTDDCDPLLKSKLEAYGVSEIKVKNGDVDFSGISEYDFEPVAGIGSDRDKNMQAYFKQLANDWSENPAVIPPDIKAILTDSQIENLNSTMVQKAFSDASFTLHEAMNGTVSVVDTYIHSKIGHFGGVALAKAWACVQLGKSYITDLINSVPGNITGSLIAEGVN